MGATCSNHVGKSRGGIRSPSSMAMDMEICGYRYGRRNCVPLAERVASTFLFVGRGLPAQGSTLTLFFSDRGLSSQASNSYKKCVLAKHMLPITAVPGLFQRGLASQANIFGYGCRKNFSAKAAPPTISRSSLFEKGLENQSNMAGHGYRSSLLSGHMPSAIVGSSLFERSLASHANIAGYGCRSSLLVDHKPPATVISPIVKRDLASHGDARSRDEDAESVASNYDDMLDEYTHDRGIKGKRNLSSDHSFSEGGMDSEEEEDECSKSDPEDEVGNPLDEEAKAIHTYVDPALNRDKMALLFKFRKNSLGVKAALAEWKADGLAISRGLIVAILSYLRRNLKYKMALEVCEWVMEGCHFDLSDMDFAYRLEFIAKVYGVTKADQFFATIPKKFKSEMVYFILLTAYVQHGLSKKADSLVQEMDKLGLQRSTRIYNQLLSVHKHSRPMGRVVELVKEMEEKNIQPDVATYNILLDLKARRGDIDGVNSITSVMAEKKIKLNKATYCAVARAYVVAGLSKQAEEALRNAETADWKISSDNTIYCTILRLYADLGNLEEVERLWRFISDSRKRNLIDYVRMIEALGILGKVERAEEIFDEMWQSKGVGRVRQVNALLSVYVKQDMVLKAEELVKKLSEESLSPNSATYHQLVQLYVKLGSEEKVGEILDHFQNNLITKSKFQSLQHKPLYATFDLILKMFAEKGDVANAERTLLCLKRTGYVPSFRIYSNLLNAYVKAGVAPYGFLDRMKLHGNVPNAHVSNTVQELKGT